jgi:hypothetical protein
MKNLNLTHINLRKNIKAKSRVKRSYKTKWKSLIMHSENKKLWQMKLVLKFSNSLLKSLLLRNSLKKLKSK